MMSRTQLRIRTWLNVARTISALGTCARRKVGCILLDEHNRVLATGYNGPAQGQPHCIDHPCGGAKLSPGQGLDLCEAIHAEQNALIQCRDATKIVTAYCTASPCIFCVKMLLNTSCRRIYYYEDYPHEEPRRLWTSSGRDWIKVDE